MLSSSSSSKKWTYLCLPACIPANFCLRHSFLLPPRRASRALTTARTSNKDNQIFIVTSGTTARVWEPPVFIPTDRPEAASLIPITRGCFEEIVYILRLSVDCQMFWVRSPSHPCSRFCPLTLQTIVYQLCSLYFLNDRQHTYVFVEQPFIYQYLFFLILNIMLYIQYIATS